jgi:hypothetical protein
MTVNGWTAPRKVLTIAIAQVGRDVQQIELAFYRSGCRAARPSQGGPLLDVSMAHRHLRPMKVIFNFCLLRRRNLDL